MHELQGHGKWCLRGPCSPLVLLWSLLCKYSNKKWVRAVTDKVNRVCLLSGRIFGKMTEMMRGAQVLGEALLANGVAKYFEDNGMVKYFEDNGMVKSETDLLKALYRISGAGAGKGGDGSEEEYISMAGFLTTDIRKYCLNQREEVLEPFTNALNGIYGLDNFFNWHCRRQKRSIPYVADPFCPPLQDAHTDTPPLDSDLVIAYPAGCVEGYCQKLWTLVSISAIRLAGALETMRIMALVQPRRQSSCCSLEECHPNMH
uniref:RNA-directed RNA polymerase n=1 Tax=Pygmy goby paramyoxyvirus FL17 TaxID=2813195 RepID=A0A894JPY3_9MONO|nr:MAG: RNA-dependent RNA polymerase [Pygmy goby paramyoxyvirus FL17]